MWTCASCLRMGSVLVGEGETYWQVEDRMLAMHGEINPECRASKLRARLYEDRPITAAGGQ